MNYDFTHFQKILEKWEIPFSSEQKEQFATYYEMLVEKNKVMNLTLMRCWINIFWIVLH